MVKKLLDLKGQKYEVINLDERPEKIEEAKSISGSIAVPITTNGTDVVVGFSPAKLMGLL